MSDIDPVQFGALTAQVATLEKQVSDLTTKMDTLLALANQSKGGFWVGMSVVAAISSAVGWAASHFRFPV